MFQAICEKYPRDTALPRRAWQIARLRQVLDGTIYDCLKYPFGTEYNGANEYIRVYDRRPSVRYNLSRLVVEDSVSLLFGDGRFPQLHTPDEAARLRLADLVDEAGLAGVMADGATRGSVGSIAFRMRVLSGRIFFDAMDTEFLTPEWRPDAPDTLLRVTERYKVAADDLVAIGYKIPADQMTTVFFFQREWTEDEEIRYQPWPVSRTERNGEPWKPRRDEARSVKHDLGFVPMAWVRNLPGGSGPDGACTFFPAIDTQMEIEYQLSQAGRGLRYSSDPLLLIKEPSGSDSSFVRSAANAIRVDEKGDAKLLEIDGGAAEAVISYARACREMALEAVHGNRSTPDKAGMAQSGRALELMHQPLIWLAGRLRTSYGNALLSLVRMALAAAEKMDVEVAGEAFRLPAGTRVSLRWGHWFAPTQHDKLEEAQALQHNAQAGHISRKTAVGLVCETHDIPDAAAEIKQVAEDQAEADARTARLAEAAAKSQVNVNDPVNG